MNTKNLPVEQIKSLYWKEGYNIKEVARKIGVSFWVLYDFMEKNDIPRRSPAEATYASNRDKPQFKLKERLTISEQNLKVAGIMLYWAEGTLKGCTVDFANSNPEMIKIFLRFLREICGVHEKRLRVYLYTHSQNRVESLKKIGLS